MGYSTMIAIPMLLFVAFSIPRTALVHAASPWRNPQTLDNFMTAMMQSLDGSGLFTKKQMDDMGYITTTMKNSVNNAAISGKSSPAMLQAFNMGFASSIAEIAVSEPGGASIDTKTQAILNALSAAYQQTTGAVDNAFINEMGRMISLFAQASANSVDASSSAGATTYASGQGGGFGAGAGAGGRQSQQSQQSAVSTSASSSYSQSYGTAAGAGNFFFNFI